MTIMLRIVVFTILVWGVAGCERGQRLEQAPIASSGTPTETEATDVQMATLDDEAVAEELAAATDAPYTAATDGSVVVNRDLYYGKEEPATLAADVLNLNALDIYAPPNAANAPVMIMIHGGGWQTGDKAHQRLLENKVPFFTENGWLFVSINYRLSPAVQHPAHVQDVATAIAWVQANIASYGGDPARLYLMGHSAGAHLAALVATDDRYLEAEGAALSDLSGVILLDGAGYDVSAQAQHARGRLQAMYLGAFTNDPVVWEDASPLHHVAADKGIPPFFISYVVRREPSRLQSQRLTAALNEAGVPAELFAAENKTHATINQEFGMAGDPLTDAAWNWLNTLSPQ